MLKHTTARYLETFAAAGFKGQISKSPYLNIGEESRLNAANFVLNNELKPGSIIIGLAPFATFQPKMWGVQNFRELVSLINAEHQAEFLLFGGGAEEIRKLEEFRQYSPNIHVVAGKLALSDELALIRKLDLMISMDSSNMHLAALSGIPTISIWGGTHPAFGFYALGQPTEYHMQTPASSLKCRPCSVFGNKPCIYAIPKCMEMVKPQDVYNNLLKFNLLKIKEKKPS